MRRPRDIRPLIKRGPKRRRRQERKRDSREKMRHINAANRHAYIYGFPHTPEY